MEKIFVSKEKRFIRLATGVNILHADFTCKDLKSAKRKLIHLFLIALLGSACAKAACKLLMNLTPGADAIKKLFLA